MFDAGRREAFYLLDASPSSARRTEARPAKRRKTALEAFENPGPSNVREFLADFEPVRERLEREGKPVSALALEMLISPSVRRVQEERRRVQDLFIKFETWDDEDWAVYRGMAKSRRLLRIEDTAGPGIPGPLQAPRKK